MKLLTLLLLPTIVYNVHSANILGVFPLPSPSHHILGSALLKELAVKGHKVTMISPYPFEKKIENYTDIYLDGVLEYKEEQMKSLMSSGNTALGMISSILSFRNMCSVILESKGLDNLLRSNQTFDLVIVLAMASEGYLGVAHHYKAPVIAFSPVGPTELVQPFLRFPSEYSYVPDILLAFSDEMTFLQRVVNTVLGIVLRCVTVLFVWPAQNEALLKLFPDSPPVQDLVRNISLILFNSHVSIENPRPYLPNMIPIGGFHIKDEELPAELKDYLDAATNGAIYFSLGSNIKSENLSREQIDAILKTFARFPSKAFIWKFEAQLPNLPKNVKIGKWLPQRAILAHPNVEVFVSHGGLLSTTEAVYFGVPIIGIPTFGDQRTNVVGAVNKGFAIKLDWGTFNEDNFYNALYDIIHNPKYRDNIRKRSSLLREQLVKPMDLAVYWVEHILKYNGGKHLQHAGLKLSWYQYYLLDVMAFLVTIFVLSGLINFFVVKKVWSFVWRKLKQPKIKTN